MHRFARVVVYLSVVLSLGFTSKLHAEDTPIDGESRPIVIISNARFTAISPRLIRMEYVAYGQFEDRPSLGFIDRTPTGVFAHTVDAQGLHILDTGEVQIRYFGQNEPFLPRTLQITQQRNGRKMSWQPDKNEAGNLKGTFRTLDGVSGATALEPGILSRSGWAVIDDSRSPVFDTVDGREWFGERKQESGVDWYYFGYGQDYKAALAEFTRVSGKIPLPPKYVFGAWWSRYWAYSDAELRELVKEFDENDVPLDVLVVDMDWHLDGWTGYTWNPEYFPDPEGFLKWAHEQGLRVTLNLHPAEGVGKHEKAFPEMCKAMGLDPASTDRIPFDCTDPKYMDAYFKLLHHPLEKMGIDFWWMDWQQGTETKIKNLDPLFALNHLHWNDMAKRATETGRRPLIFSRWGGLGNHRYQIGFSGDTFCNWASLAFQPWFTATAGNVGYAYWSHDIGGHQPGPVDPEMYVRWIQWGALSPVLRTHTTKNPLAERRIWKFPKPYFEAARKAYQLRYELIPYIYTMARKCHDTAVPLCRPFYYEFPSVNEAYDARNAYYFGDDLVVAPVVEAAEPVSGCAMVETWLPPGNWVNWFSGQRYRGGQVVHVVTPLDEIPLFVKAGAVIPMATQQNRTGGSTEPLVLTIFSGGDGECRVYEDDGLSGDYLSGRGAWTRVRSLRGELRQHIAIDATEGDYDGMRSERDCEIRLQDVGPPTEVRMGDEVLASATPGSSTGWWYDKDSFQLVIRTGKKSRSHAIDLSVTYEAIRSLDAMLEGGLRGRIARLREISESFGGRVPAIIASALDAGGCLFRPPPEEGQRPELVSATDTRGLVEALREAMPEDRAFDRAATRLLGVYRRLDMSPRLSSTSPHYAALAASVCGPFLKNDETKVALKLDVPVGWTSQGGERADATEAGLSASAQLQIIPPSEEVVTTVLEGSVRIDLSGFSIPIRVRRTVFPSINGWWVIGPFHAKFTESPDMTFPPEKGVDLTAAYEGKDGRNVRWRKVTRRPMPGDNPSDEFFIDFDDFVGARVYESVAYGFTWLDSPEDCAAVLALGSDDGAVVWLNGEEVHRVHVGRPYTSKQDRVPVRLKKGENTLLIKISQDGGDWGFGVHVETPEGEPMTQVLPRLTPAADAE